MRLKTLVALVIFLGGNTFVFAQIGIDNVNPISTFPNDTTVITGSGFSGTMNDLEVWFGAVEGLIVASSEFAIEVVVPVQARATNITVINKATDLSATSEMKFIPILKTEPFNTSKFSQGFTSTSSNELFDLCVCDLNNDGKPDVT